MTNMTVQRDLGVAPEIFEVWYDGAGGQIAAGYAVCFDPTVAVDAAAGAWNEQERFKVVQKPATANLNAFAGIVVDPLRQSGTTPGFIKIAVPTRGTAVKALVKANATAITTVLAPVNAEWHLAADADAIGAYFTYDSVALAGETADTSGTAANKVIFGVL